MRFAVNVPNFDKFADVRLVADLAHEAEQAGWDGFFIWDHIGADWPVPMADPWIELAAIALATERIKLGAIVTPLPRRRPWKLSREAVTLDHLSNGRLVLGVGLGSDLGREYSCYGESTNYKLHAEMVDEGLEILMGLWSGEPFTYSGKHYQLNGAQYLPKPVQQPRIPIWVGGTWPLKKPFRRAAQWDGVCPLGKDHMMTRGEIAEMLAYIREQRTTEGPYPYEVILGGRSYEKGNAEAREMLAEYESAGVTWWFEGFDWTNPIEQVHEVVRKGPPEIR
jgi:alkanesulfonate monooxygenase SsuD/methylene tetrahydromethanopterin reductase-like flavin-dependent oxidoreductase (luciferase family)